MLMLAATGGLALLWLVLNLRELKRRGGLIELESQHPPEMAAIWLRVATGYKLVIEDKARGLFVWERGRRFHDGGLFYYGEVWRHARTGRAHFVVGVIGHKFHTAEELARARSRFVATQVFHLTARSGGDALARAGDPRTARSVHPAMRKLMGRLAHRPPAIDTTMSPSAVRFSIRAPLSEVGAAIADLSQSGWRLVETATLNRGLITQHRYCFRDAGDQSDAAAEYLLEVCGYESGWSRLAIDWFPHPEKPRPSRRPTELEADLKGKLARVHATAEPAE